MGNRGWVPVCTGTTVGFPGFPRRAGEGGFQTRPYRSRGAFSGGVTMCALHGAGESPSPQPSPVEGEGAGAPRPLSGPMAAGGSRWAGVRPERVRRGVRGAGADAGRTVGHAGRRDAERGRRVSGLERLFAIAGLAAPDQRLIGLGIAHALQLGRVVWFGAGLVQLLLCQAGHRPSIR